MRFPQEIIDEIVSHLPLDKQGQQSLRNCSLAARSLLSPSRRSLFETVLITFTNRHSWLKNISPTNVELLRHVRSLTIGIDLSYHYFNHRNAGDFYDYFPSFHRLHTIKLSSSLYIAPGISERMQMFSSCQQSLSSLIFAGVLLHWCSFIALIDYFPNLRNLELWRIWFEDRYTNPPPLSRPLRGKLCLCPSLNPNLEALSHWFTGLEVEYEELAIKANPDNATSIYSQRIITACEKTLKRLNFGMRLSHCSELCEVEFSALRPTQTHTTTISSIASINLSKITFSSQSQATTLDAFLDYPHWTDFDNCISALADKLGELGSRRTLEVEFRFEPDPDSVDPPWYLRGFLPKFGEKGRVRIVDLSNGRDLVTEDPGDVPPFWIVLVFPILVFRFVVALLTSFHP